ncbi:hypothetical protein B0H16DRAFT_1769936 [Mycena metata]|uniref:Uncharacterized protein n=1 Tax=Mycena metata TaxID=1033252 RepID=A0AAD7MUM5_9AGAR|nr:hypothetical protein B0H16DRAFT_1769936 [Mycena metata]
MYKRDELPGSPFHRKESLEAGRNNRTNTVVHAIARFTARQCTCSAAPAPPPLYTRNAQGNFILYGPTPRTNSGSNFPPSAALLAARIPSSNSAEANNSAGVAQTDWEHSHPGVQSNPPKNHPLIDILNAAIAPLIKLLISFPNDRPVVDSYDKERTAVEPGILTSGGGLGSPPCCSSDPVRLREPDMVRLPIPIDNLPGNEELPAKARSRPASEHEDAPAPKRQATSRTLRQRRSKGSKREKVVSVPVGKIGASGPG